MEPIKVLINNTINIMHNFEENNHFRWYLASVSIALCCAFLFYPGFFSDDSFSQMNQAFSHDYGSWHPAMMAISMHYFYPLLGVGGLLIVHQLLYWLGVALIIDAFFKRNYLFYLFGFFIPIFLNTLPIWKDVGALVCCMVSIGLFGAYIKNHNRSIVIIAVAFIFLLYATLIKWTMLAPICVLIFFSYMLFFGKGFKGFVVSVLLCLTFAFVSVVALKGVNNIYNVKIQNPLPTVLLWDIAGICNLSGKECDIPKFIDVVNKEKAKKWTSYYHSYNCDFCWMAGISCELSGRYKSKDLVALWWTYVSEDPYYYIKHRLILTKYLFGLKKNVYFPHHNFNQNLTMKGEYLPTELGVKAFNGLSVLAKYFQRIFLYHPITWILCSIFCLIYIIKKRFGGLKEVTSIERMVFVLSFSGVVNAFCMALIAPAADYRYVLYSVFCGFLSLLMMTYNVLSERYLD